MITRPPYGSSLGEVAWEVLVAAAIFDQEISVVFSEDGIYQLRLKEHVDGPGLKNYCKEYMNLPNYGVDRLYADQASMIQRGVDACDLYPIASPLDDNQISALLARADHILTF